MSDISITYEFPFICSPFWCPQEGGNLDVLFRDLFHVSQTYSAFTTHFLFPLTHLQTQICNEIMYHHLKHDLCIIIPIDLPPLTGVAWHFYFFYRWLIWIAPYSRPARLNSRKLKGRMPTVALLVKQLFLSNQKATFQFFNFIFVNEEL